MPPSTGKSNFQFRMNAESGVPLYRQIIDQVQGGIASGALAPGDQLPTVRQVAVDLAINLNTVLRAYRELEIRGFLDTQQGTGTFVSDQKVKGSSAARERKLEQLATEFVSRAGADGFTVRDLIQVLTDNWPETKSARS
ncbi:MAG: GntR family transcriptional regulator [Bryobacterales bacterium]|nr:GntR family transcriptional regulator [Bryobacterales bacterium]